MRLAFSESSMVYTLDQHPGVAAPPRGILTPGPWLQSMVDDLVATLFPSDCRTCHVPLLRAGFSPVCDACVARVAPQTSTLCRICGEAIGMESDRFAGQYPAEGVLCTVCRFVPPPFERAVAYGVHQDELRELIHLLKYDRVRAVAKPMGAMLTAAIISLALTGEVLLVAVPLFATRQRQRGFNQSVLLADEAAGLLKKSKPVLRLRPRHRLLRRIRDTESQFALNPHGRRANVRGAFEVNEAIPVAGRTVLLVDDVFTTGATSRECARVLRKAGAARVFVATVSRAQDESFELWDAHTDPGEIHTFGGM